MGRQPARARARQYNAHFDWFDPAGDFYADNTRQGGNRLVTVFAYLQAPAAGGHTEFPALGLSFPPIAGDGTVFFGGAWVPPSRIHAPALGRVWRACSGRVVEP